MCKGLFSDVAKRRQCRLGQVEASGDECFESRNGGASWQWSGSGQSDACSGTSGTEDSCRIDCAERMRRLGERCCQGFLELVRNFSLNGAALQVPASRSPAERPASAWASVMRGEGPSANLISQGSGTGQARTPAWPYADALLSAVEGCGTDPRADCSVQCLDGEPILAGECRIGASVMQEMSVAKCSRKQRLERNCRVLLVSWLDSEGAQCRNPSEEYGQCRPHFAVSPLILLAPRSC